MCFLCLAVESHGVPGMTHLSAASYDKLQRPGTSRARHRGTVDVKGLGPMETYLVPGLADGESDAQAAPSGGFYSAGGRAGGAASNAAAVPPAEDSAATADATAALGSASLAGSHLRSPRGSVSLHLSPAEAQAEAAAANAEAAALRRQGGGK